jgi:hypothetical protein
LADRVIEAQQGGAGDHQGRTEQPGAISAILDKVASQAFAANLFSLSAGTLLDRSSQLPGASLA